jgi:prepilin-type processing-associated H-X9-DG protein
MEFAGQQSGGPPNGVFQYVGQKGSSFGIQAIRDGSSNTIAFGEWRTGSGTPGTTTLPTDIIFIGRFPTGASRNNGTLTMPRLAATFPEWISWCSAAAKAGDGYFGKSTTLGQNWALGLVGYSLGNTLLPPNPPFPNCSVNASGTLQSPGLWGLSSYHPGGAMVLLADGSVKFLKDSTTREVVWALGSRSGGEIVSADQF